MLWSGMFYMAEELQKLLAYIADASYHYEKTGYEN